MVRPIIGLIPLYDDEKESYWMLPGYMKALEECGALPIMLPLTDDEDELIEAFSLCDGILLTGGHDVSPAVYGSSPIKECGVPCDLRDKMEAFLLDLSLECDKPVFGICRGIQFMNAYLGGTLYQDLPSQYDSSTEHHMTKPYDQAIHEVEVIEGTHLACIIGAGKRGVNSYHHQAIKDLAPGLKKMAISEDGLIEAVEVEGKLFAIGVQWHPEFSYENNEDSIKILQAFVEACKIVYN